MILGEVKSASITELLAFIRGTLLGSVWELSIRLRCRNLSHRTPPYFAIPDPLTDNTIPMWTLETLKILKLFDVFDSLNLSPKCGKIAQPYKRAVTPGSKRMGLWKDGTSGKNLLNS